MGKIRMPYLYWAHHLGETSEGRVDSLKRVYSFLFISLYCALGSGVHVQIIQDCCIDTYMAMWFAASIPLSPISGISPHVISP